MQNITASLSEQKINELVKEFLDNYTMVIRKAAKNVQLENWYFDDLVDQIALKYSNGQLSFDPSKNTKDTTYVYQIARNAAIDMKRKNHRWSTATVIDESDPNCPQIEDLYDCPVSEIEIDDMKKIVRQTFLLMEKKYGISQEKLKLFLEWKTTSVSVRILAEKHHLNPNRLGVQLSKIKKKYEEVFRQLLKEEALGTLNMTVEPTDYCWIFGNVA